ncbi:MAG: Asparagine synthetase [glutamine-hydrolyzing] 1 [Candidatus Accumulibacter regalis]|uniref:asparagine synthase (glutamine-hydrolyzing) n=2 Tax=Candidatus Accumulibacter TaxID=327159 RepID=A0A011RAW2_ACCRE|nr:MULTISPECIES: asparagine synthase (glutamine-hydrolyzing) [unclassified Candidatus Accumulibacter]EXI88314.1 MAG: Asparagine synthetase [glutamine-hydrolyzing] 1 [Candidatus Accumulibacter regalis]MQM33601.1 asparagine synthetase B [Candidatus Accumulibacter phosphatis]HRE71216.1 asparagine synthase (glutamine-hydrolyzing) [Accumulibacter sp.]HRE85822.1 asparagine synthase (glutamine-hydrolyzing) [Accumulibacter sp.]
MCGIHGIYRFDGLSVEPRMLSSMGDRIRHRGPDDEGSHVDGPCGIGMRRLSIIDLAGGHQPLSNADGTLWLVCNGEIYNFRELRSELQGKGYRFKTGSDSEVLLHLYDAEGDDFVLRLNGMFDFALWDARRRRLLIGRDRLGVKPLYVLQDWQRLAFASEAKALLALPGVSAELNREVVADYLHLGYVAAPGCIFKGIRKLPPATLLAVEDGEVREWRYWRLPEEIVSDLSESQWIERVQVQLDESVRMQMVSDVPIGAFLSGGVDSSAVVGLMARHSEQPIRTYAIGFSGGEAEALYNELPYARQVAKLFATNHREIVVQPDVVALLPKLLWHMDEPLSDTAFITTYLVSAFAREDVKVILSGVGGDELFGGYRRYLGGHYARRYRRWPGWLRRMASYAARRLPTDRHSGLLNNLRLAKGFMASAEMSSDERYRSYLQVLSRRHVSALLLEESAAGPSDSLARAFAAAGNEDELNRMFAVDAETQLPDDLLLLTDKMSMAVSLECRVPLLDHQLVELAAAMPAAIKVRDGRLKHLLKASLADLLPDEILNRKKRGFGTPMGAWLKRELAPLLKRLLAADVVQARGLFNQGVVNRLIADHQANRIDGTDILLAMMNLEIWSRIFLDRRDPADVAEELKSYVA